MFRVFYGAGSRSRTYEGRSRQIYSLMRLTTSLSQQSTYLFYHAKELTARKSPHVAGFESLDLLGVYHVVGSFDLSQHALIYA